MPLTFKRYMATAAAKIDEPDAFDSLYQLRITIEVNDYVLPQHVCADLTSTFHAFLLKYADNLTDVASTVNEIEVPTKEETEAKVRKAATDYLEEIKDKDASMGAVSPGLVALIIEDQKSKATWSRLSGRKLEIVNELLETADYAPMEKTDWED